MTMEKYPKINTIWKRDKDGKIIDGEYSCPEFDNIRFWRVLEKIDGMNMRIVFKRYDKGVLTCDREFKGRTDNAQIPDHLLTYLEKTFPLKKLKQYFQDGKEVILFGEGYGKKIQSDKYKLGDKVKFILFDVWIDGWWLEHDNVEEIAKALKIDSVPVIDTWNDTNIIQHIKYKPKSRLNEDVVIEGYVAKSYPMVMFRDGTPVMWKIKVKDYE